ncbi:efflux RND transporter periplasmic adaptor subunit [Aquisalimonas sp. 2447]|uniref:efflux RND transporter periplasmic adaptor subunit n=1 Tax=Aquisalimonas sp. 2447 TaxID=2740807 RepID=UPI0014323503|nr:efflux RND transporter periplasmic adaptor subunit [Aquisalimonas sp. 2447]QIT54447.1 efflux RND transporter periplasmic adaptor subunit [Aquisalimonas sp. 2447]
MKARLIAVLCMSSLLAGCSPEEDVPEVTPVGIGVYELTESEIRQQWHVVGRTQAVESVAIRARIEGEVNEVLFQRGGRVDAGEVLFRLNDDMAREQVRRAEAQVNSRRSANTLAQSNFQRGLELRAEGYLSTADLDRLRNEAEQAESALEDAEAALRQSRLNLDYTVIRAPISGRAGDTRVTLGDLVSPASGVLLEIIDPDPIRVQFQLTDREFSELSHMRDQAQRAIGLDAFALLDGHRRHPFPGIIEFVDIVVQETTGTVAATASFANPEETLLPGQFVTLLIERSDPVPGLLVPEQAVQRNQLGPFVMRVGPDGTVSQRQLTLGSRYGSAWQVEDGLQVGDLVVVEGLQKIRPDMPAQLSYYDRDPETGLLAPREMIQP